MSFDTGLRLFLAVILLIGAVASWRRSRSAPALERLGVQFVERNLAIVEEQFVPVVNGHFRREQEAGAFALLIAALAILLIPFDTEESPAAIYAMSALATGLICGGLALVSAWEATRPFMLDGTALRTARLRSVTVGDLTPPWLRLLAWAAVAGLAVVVSLTVSASASSTRLAVTVGVAALCVGLLATEVSARRVCAAPEPATDAAHLYWQDALRADSVGTGYSRLHFGAALVWSGWATTLQSGEVWLGVSPRTALVLGAAPLVISLAGQTAWSTGNDPWFRRRLWPGLAKGEVIAPGRRVAA